MTQRSYAEILALFPNNTSGDISEQDLRDYVDSVKPPFGSLSIDTPAATTIVTPGTFVKAAGSTIAGGSYLMTPDTSGRITYNGASDRHFHIVASVSMTCAANNQTAALRIAKNGVTIAASQLRRQIATGADIGSTALHADTTLSTDDYLELYLTNQTSTGTITVQDFYFYCMGMFT